MNVTWFSELSPKAVDPKLSYGALGQNRIDNYGSVNAFPITM